MKAQTSRHSFPIFDQIKLAWSPIKEQAPIKEMAPIEEMATLLFRAKSIPAMAFEQAQPWLQGCEQRQYACATCAQLATAVMDRGLARLKNASSY